MADGTARPAWLEELAQSPGSDWVRVVLQLNPFEYVQRHRGDRTFTTAEAYNAALVDALAAEQVGLVAVTDHFRFSSSDGLIARLSAEGIVALPGFEACTSEGVHILALFPEGTTEAEVQQAITKCNVHDLAADSPVSALSTTALTTLLAASGAVCVAAHATVDNGILRALQGTPRALAWKSEALEAAGIPGAVDEVPEPMQSILRNDDAAHKRLRPMAMVNAGDVASPDDLKRPGTKSWLRLSERSLRGIRHAFGDPLSRIRLASDPVAAPRPVLKAVHWDGGFLDDQTLVLSEHLNVLVGAPGSGKSTVIESVRAAFGDDAHSARAQEDHSSLCSAALASATISVVVEHPYPKATTLVVQRTMPHPPTVIDAETWKPSDRPVSDLSPLPDIYGQHEVADLARDQQRRTQLLERFVSSQGAEAEEISQLTERLDELDGAFVSSEANVDQLQSSVALLPGKREELAKWEEQGIAEHLAEETLFQREHRAIKDVEDKFTALEKLVSGVPSKVPAEYDLAEALAESPFRSRLEAALTEFAGAKGDVEATLADLSSRLVKRRTEVEAIRAEWKIRRTEAESRLAEIRHKLETPELAKGFKAIREEVDRLTGAERELPAAQAALSKLRTERRAALLEIERQRSAELRRLQKAAASVTTRLGGRVRVTVSSTEGFQELKEVAQDTMTGFRQRTLETFRTDEQFSCRSLAEVAGSGKDALQERWKLSDHQARLLASLTPDELRRVERVAPVVSTAIELNVGDAEKDRWRQIEDLSKGQKATAILLLLLLDSDAPLIVDQPEDDLDNRFIVEDVVPALRGSKRERQFVFATHNANVPVLADAELVAGLTADGDASGQGHSRFLAKHLGSIDRESVRNLIEDQLEGGREAFAERARRYGRK